MANKKVKTVTLSKERFREARKLRGMSLEKLANHPEINRTVKTLNRWISKEEIPIELLDSIGHVLNVDPNYISRRLDEILAVNAESQEEFDELKKQFHAYDHPYVEKMRRDLEPLQYITELLIHNNIDPKQLDDYSLKEQMRIFLEIEKATFPILMKYFKPHYSSIHNYSMPMPPEEEIISF